MNKQIINNAINIINKSNIIVKTNLEKSMRLSNKFNTNIFLKREDLQSVRSFKIRGAYYKIMNNISHNMVTSVSAGNHAQGVALTCNYLKKRHNIFLPVTTPLQKINKIKDFGEEYLTLHTVGDNFDESEKAALEFNKNNNSLFVHPFDDYDIIAGQSTIVHEIFEEIEPDIILCPIGGGGLISGILSYIDLYNKKTEVIGVEPLNANSMEISLNNNLLTPLTYLDTFVDGASVKLVGKNTFNICQHLLKKIKVIKNNKLCYHMIDVYQKDGIILEPAGCLSIAALDTLKSYEIENKNIVCLLTGGNNDIMRYPEIIEKSLLYQNLKHYFLINFTQSPGQLKKFINVILGPTDDITRFEYLKKTNRDFGTVFIGIEVLEPEDIYIFINKLSKTNFKFIKLHEKDLLYSYLI
tara:strand:- start:2793 stop:4025 length:1233 start_codon:yes stop_codon:yes gene_type:complete